MDDIETGLAARLRRLSAVSKCGVAGAQRVSTCCFTLLALLLTACDDDESKPEDAGKGAVVEKTIDPAVGGSVEMPGGPAVNIPAGGLPAGSDVTISLSVTSPSEVTPPVGAESPVWEFGPAGTMFAKPVPVELPFDLGDRDPNEYAIAWTTPDGSDFEDLPTTFADGKAMTMVNHFSRACIRRRPEPKCNDGVRNGTETDIDCGGTCGGCASGSTCVVGTDCTNGMCVNTVCAMPAATCMDNTKNGDETDTDCGGGCPDCVAGKACTDGNDCQSGVCTNTTCRAATCTDTVKNDSESDVDCGGTNCPKCANSKACSSQSDCMSNLCSNSMCAAQGPTCKDGNDCQSGVCTNTTCRAATCTDTVKNDSESDVDCGGTNCPKCANSKACSSQSDCMSNLCSNSMCAAPAPTCSDQMKNGTESDVDCGGSCPDCPNPECPQGIAPANGPYAQKGACCYRTSNSARISTQTGETRTLEYRMKYFLTTNHQMTMGNLATFTINRFDREEGSVLYRLTVPWANGKMAAGMGTFQVGAGRYNCDKGTYSFYSKTAAPVRAKLTDPARWESATVPVVVNPDGATVAEQIKPVWAQNMKSRIPSFTPYLRTDGDKPLEWEASSQSFTFEQSPKIDDQSVDCVGARDETIWVKGGVVRDYVRIDSNNLDPIPVIGGITLAQLQAFGTSVAGDKDNPANNPETAYRCMPGSQGCKWLKLPESLCPVGDAEQMSWGCHVGWADNPDNLTANCTPEAPTGVLDPDKGATSEGQCCDPLGMSTTIPKCNSWINLIDFVSAAADITDELANEVQQNCMK